MSDAKQRLGRWGERIASSHLTAHGFQILEKNYRCSAGEIDIVSKKRDQWVFVEVKTRRGDEYGSAEQALTERKKSRILEVASHYFH